MRHIMQSSGVLCLVLAAASCAGEANEAVPDVTGKWCGSVVAEASQCQGDEVGYLDLVQTGDRVTGKACEAYEKDCMVLQDARVSNGQLTFFYTFSDYRVDATLAVTAGTLTGNYVSDKCSCTIPLTLHRTR